MEMNVKKLAGYIALPLAVGILSSLLTRGGMEVFGMLDKPPLSPPGWLFPVVWTILYTLMGISSYLVDTSGGDSQQITKSLKLYLYQLLVNFLWPVFFFNLGWYLFSFFWIILLWILVAWMIKEFEKVSKAAAYLNIPYLIWLTVAAYLNLGIWLLNR